MRFFLLYVDYMHRESLYRAAPESSVKSTTKYAVKLKLPTYPPPPGTVTDMLRNSPFKSCADDASCLRGAYDRRPPRC